MDDKRISRSPFFVQCILLLFLIPGISTCIVYRDSKTSWKKDVKEIATIRMVDSHGAASGQLTVGSNLEVSLSGLLPETLYSVLLKSDEGDLISWARLTSNEDGRIPATILWYQTGVKGCARGVEAIQGPYWFKTHEEALNAMRGKPLHLEVYDIKKRLVARNKLPAPVHSKEPVLYAGNKDGCLMNTFVEGKQDAYVAGRNFPAGSIVEIYLVPAKYRWNLRDGLNDIRGESRKRDVMIVRLRENQTSFVEKLWNAEQMRAGSYDLVARHYLEGEDHIEWDFYESRDIVTYESSSGFVVQRVWGMDPHLSEDIAGRKIYRNPWFEHVDGFVKGQDVWGAIDPKKKSTSN